jgi:L-alanine-DL-glutamate epimerase-like enolase superfamily enzyme
VGVDVVERYVVTRFEVDPGRLIGDSQISTRRLSIGVLELEDSAGRIGTGFFHSVRESLPSLIALQAQFEREIAGDLVGESPFCWTNKLERPRGGNIRTSPFYPSMDQAMWDLQAQALGVPLHELLGSRRHRVRAYASGLEFHLPDDDVAAFYATARDAGFAAFKVKVGHESLARDIRRLKLVQDVVGSGCQLMADANEAWSPKEAIRRLHAYHDEGITLYWIEDPCLRDDFDGLRQISEAVPFTLVNAGEYLGVSGKRELIERRAVDVINLHGSISDAMRIGWLAGEHGIPIAVGNTDFEIGVHVAAALPEVVWLEYSFLSYNHLVEEPIEFREGWAVLPNRPGHGLRLADSARQELAAPS